ncbi:MAG: hypothetical protein ACKO5L_04390 [Bacteroidota bacterium]
MRVAHVMSVVLATLSFLATKEFESFGVQRFYENQAENFNKETGYFDMQHPDQLALQKALFNMHRFAALDSAHWLYKPQCCERGLVFQSLDSNTTSKVLPLPESQVIADFIAVDTLLYLIDADMQIYQSAYPFDSSSTHQVSKNKPTWECASLCYHKPTRRIIFCASQPHAESRQRSLYYYSLSQNRYYGEPIFSFDADEVLLFLEKKEARSCLDQPRLAKEIPMLIPNAIAVHPKTNDFYMLSSKDRVLMVFSPFGNLLDVTYLEESIYTNPTDIHFNEQGDLFIANQANETFSLVKLPWNRLWQSKANKEEMPFFNSSVIYAPKVLHSTVNPMPMD